MKKPAHVAPLTGDETPAQMLKRLHAIIDNTNPKVTHIIGVDESGTGAFAGPFYTSAVLTSRYWTMDVVRDSKLTSKHERDVLVELIDEAVACHAETAGTVASIEKIGQAATWTQAMTTSVRDVVKYLPRGVTREQLVVIVDGSGSSSLRESLRALGVLTMFVKKADTFVPAVSAASIFAKFHRDVEMNLLDKKFPQYNFGTNAGYGTEEHRKAIKKYGRIPQVHRPCTEEKRS
jgi:ribonuclease HII